MRFACSTLFLVVTALGVACGGPVLTAAAEGDPCDTGQVFTCNQAQDTVLECSASHLWVSRQPCDSTCTIEDPEGAAPACCDGVEGEKTCFEQNGMVTNPSQTDG